MGDLIVGADDAENAEHKENDKEEDRKHQCGFQSQRTSLLMFPIYGMGALLGPISRGVDKWIGGEDKLTLKDKFWRHGFGDMVLIFCAEYLTGSFLRARNICPWDYSGRIFNIDGLIRLDFAQYWFAAGLLFEKITLRSCK